MKTHHENTVERIVQIPGILGGKPVIKGTRIPVDLILERLTFDLDLKTLFEDYPELTEADIGLDHSVGHFTLSPPQQSASD